ncbi:hypothetical protein DBR42_04605 [Pelomonas sp. HMWF004]|nr:hypothetical protein DBR42_04605 [Pelomonas sp. HMWF004]
MLDNHAALSNPTSIEHFCRLMQAICREAGTSRFLAVCLQGHSATDIVKVLHNASEEVASSLTAARHWSVDRMIDTVLKSRTPVLFGDGGAPAITVPGFESGVGAMSHLGHNSYVLFFGNPASAIKPDAVFALMGEVQLALQCAVEGLASLVAGACPLTQREVQCLMHFMANHTPKETARALGISARTVEHHLERARVRLGVGATLAAAATAIRNGWISLDDIQALQAAA